MDKADIVDLDCAICRKPLCFQVERLSWYDDDLLNVWCPTCVILGQTMISKDMANRLRNTVRATERIKAERLLCRTGVQLLRAAFMRELWERTVV